MQLLETTQYTVEMIKKIKCNSHNYMLDNRDEAMDCLNDVIVNQDDIIVVAKTR